MRHEDGEEDGTGKDPEKTHSDDEPAGFCVFDAVSVVQRGLPRLCSIVLAFILKVTMFTL